MSKISGSIRTAVWLTYPCTCRQQRNIPNISSSGNRSGVFSSVPLGSVSFHRIAAILGATSSLMRVFELLILLHPNPQRQLIATKG